MLNLQPPERLAATCPDDALNAFTAPRAACRRRSRVRFTMEERRTRPPYAIGVTTRESRCSTPRRAGSADALGDGGRHLAGDTQDVSLWERDAVQSELVPTRSRSSTKRPVPPSRTRRSRRRRVSPASIVPLAIQRRPRHGCRARRATAQTAAQCGRWQGRRRPEWARDACRAHRGGSSTLLAMLARPSRQRDQGRPRHRHERSSARPPRRRSSGITSRRRVQHRVRPTSSRWARSVSVPVMKLEQRPAGAARPPTPARRSARQRRRCASRRPPPTPHDRREHPQQSATRSSGRPAARDGSHATPPAACGRRCGASAISPTPSICSTSSLAASSGRRRRPRSGLLYHDLGAPLLRLQAALPLQQLVVPLADMSALPRSTQRVSQT